MKTIPIILEYEGGARTARLHALLSDWNPKTPVLVFDNGSPGACSPVVTHHNPQNSGVGGGIRACVRLAESMGAEYLLLITNDIDPRSPVDFQEMERVAEDDPDVVQVACSFSSDSHNASYYSWLASQAGNKFREVPHSDMLCCLIRLSFLKTFGGFPESFGGWGYDFELAYQAKIQKKKIMVCDHMIIRHQEPLAGFHLGWKIARRSVERKMVYDARYGDFNKIRPDVLGRYRPGRMERILLLLEKGRKCLSG